MMWPVRKLDRNISLNGLTVSELLSEAEKYGTPTLQRVGSNKPTWSAKIELQSVSYCCSASFLYKWIKDYGSEKYGSTPEAALIAAIHHVRSHSEKKQAYDLLRRPYK